MLALMTSRRALLILGVTLFSLSAFAAAYAAPVAIGPALGTQTVRLAYATETARSPSRVWLATASGREAKLLGLGAQPLLAPDGQAVAVSEFGATANTEKGPSIGVYPAAGAPVATYLNLETAIATPLAWSPDSRYLAVALLSTAVTNTASSAGSGLDVIDVETGAVTPIAEGVINGASFAPDGSDRIVFGRSPSQLGTAPSNLYVSGPEGAGVQALTNDGRSLNPLWGPRYIAYDRERSRSGYAPLFQIWLLAPGSGAPPRRITNVSVDRLVSGLVPMDFSADGSRLLAEFEGQDTSEAWTVTVSSARARRVLVRGRSVQAAGISRDGRTLLIDEHAFEEAPSNGRVSQLPFAGGRSKVLVAHGAEGSWNG